jgi:hypothetical protein
VPLTFSEKPFQWFAQGQYDYPFHSQGNYVPGKEFDAAVGSYYNFGRIGPFKELAPMLTLYGAFRSHDLGEAANTPNSGYERLLLAPGGEIKIGLIRFYADFEVPVFQHYNGQQLTAPYAIKTIVSYDFWGSEPDAKLALSDDRHCSADIRRRGTRTRGCGGR